ncbi:MAG: ArsB/NhaD family transporter [Thermoplasmata archaeon]|jgi:Na+/H+ antiporter NhaD/arsenite permease-like protein
MTNLVAGGLLAAVFGLIIFRQFTGRGPAVWLTFAVGGGAAVATEALSLRGAASVLLTSALPVVTFLWAMFLFATELEISGALDHIARWLVGQSRTARDLPLVLFLGFGVASALIVNDALVLIGVPILLHVARRLKTDPKPLLLTLAFSVTVGSVVTPLGNPQNLLVSLASGLTAPIAVFLRYLLLPTAAGLLVGGYYLKWQFGSKLAPAEATYPQIRAETPNLWLPGRWGARIRDYPSLMLFPATVLVLFGADIGGALGLFTAPPIWEIATGGGVAVLLLSAHRLRLLREIPWSILALFVGLFLVVQASVEGGVIAAVEGLFPLPGPGSAPVSILALTATSLVGSQVVSNVPWVALQIPLLSGLGYSGSNVLAWLALAGASTLAGNVSLLGAASNLIVAERAERSGVRISLGEFVRYGLPLAGITVGILVAALLLGI